jgi:hypothetical protein
MTAYWQIKTTGEVLSVLVTKNQKAFEKLINDHHQMVFLRWE